VAKTRLLSIQRSSSTSFKKSSVKIISLPPGFSHPSPTPSGAIKIVLSLARLTIYVLKLIHMEFSNCL
jgi:hypothetical protein